jgi:type IV secretory pathway TrbD component
MKWAGMYLFGFIVLLGGVLAALWKLGVLERIGTAFGVGIMIAVSNSGTKENVEINRK